MLVFTTLMAINLLISRTFLYILSNTYLFHLFTSPRQHRWIFIHIIEMCTRTRTC